MNKLKSNKLCLILSSLFSCSSLDLFLFLLGYDYNVVSVSAVQKSESAKCIHISTLFKISFPFWTPQSIE